MTLPVIRSLIETTEQDVSLLEEKGFDRRADVVEFIEFPIISQLDELLQTDAHRGEVVQLHHRAEKLRARLERVDTALFYRLREEIGAGRLRGRAFKSLMEEYFGGKEAAGEDLDRMASTEAFAETVMRPEYDNVDVFINRLLYTGEMPVPTQDLEPEMVGYYKTPARVVLELIEKAPMTNKDVFVDLGSGLGGTVLLVHLLTGVRARGIERESAYHTFAAEGAAGLGLQKAVPGEAAFAQEVAFVQGDVREADLSVGTVFFLFTPFTGVLLQEVLDRLRKEAIQRKIRIVTYGPCTTRVSRQNWLRPLGSTADEGYRLQVFCSGVD